MSKANKGPVLPVFYTPKMIADSGSFSPSAGKPAVVMAAWREMALPIEVIEPEPVTFEQLCLAHDPAYVRGVLDGTVSNGFGNTRTDVILSLPYTSGAILAATRYAIRNPEQPAACAPVSGMHHAGYDFGGGYCTFSGLVIAAVAVIEEGLAKRVGICDLDAHRGNGTEACLEHLDPALAACIDHYTIGAHYHGPHQADRFMHELPGIVEQMASDCDVIIFQAGQDLHRDDPLGGVLSTEQMTERDRIVFTVARAHGCNVAYDHAGGYRVEKDGSIPLVIAGHTATAMAALSAAENVRASG